MIRWEEDFGEYADERMWLGYLGKIVVCTIGTKNDLELYLTGDMRRYTNLSSAKRGAERMLATFLRDAGLEVKG